MPPFAEFRLWVRQATQWERTSAALAAVVVLAVLGWTISPAGVPSASAPIAGAAPAATSTGGSTGTTVTAGVASSGGAGSPQSVAGESGPAGSTSGSGATVPANIGAAPAPAGGSTRSSAARCQTPPGTAPGVTSRQIKIAIIEVGIFGPAGNAAFAEPSPQEQHDWYQEVIDHINASGGIACRRIVPTYYSANPANQSDLQQKCLDIASSGVFAVIDIGAYGPFPQKDCYAQHHIPFFTGYIMTAQEQQQFYPYLFASETFDTLYRNTVFALHDRGFFDPARGFRKLGFVYETCYPYLIDSVLTWLHQVGVPDSSIVKYGMGCPAAFPAPSDQEQAVLAFQRAGVTHVTTANFVGGLQGFTQAAQQQHFHPKYGIPDDYLVPISYGTQHPDYDNMDGAIAITANRNGEEHTPGMRPTGATARCNAILTAHGAPPVYEQPSGLGGMICSELWLFKAAVEHSPVLSREALAVGFQAAKTVDLAYPEGPNDLSGARNTVWMNEWRTDEFFTRCKCWRVVDAKFRPSYS